MDVLYNLKQIEFVLSGEDFFLNEIPGNLDLQLKILMIEKLIDYGLLHN